MAFDSTKYQLTQLLQDAWYRLGQLKRWKLTGGSATTAINTNWAGVEDALFEDDDAALIYGTVVCIEDAGGSHAAPEGEMGMITDYDSASQTITLDSLSSALGVNDKIGIASPLFPMEDMIELANIAIQKLGEIDRTDYSIVTTAGVTEYSLPTSVRQKPLRVRQQTVQGSNNNKWKLVEGWDVVPSAPGVNWTLIVPSLATNYELEILYRAPHPKLTAFDSHILDGINPELILCALIAEAYQWYNNQLGGSNQYFLQRENKALQDLEAALVKFPIRRTVEQVQGLPHWGRDTQYVPLTSDARY